MAIQGNLGVFWGQWKGDKGLNNVGLISQCCEDVASESPGNRVSGNVRFMRIFARVPWRRGVIRQWGNRKRRFSVLSDKVFGTLRNEPILLYLAENIHYKFKRSQASKARLQSSKHTGTKQNLTQNSHSGFTFAFSLTAKYVTLSRHFTSKRLNFHYYEECFQK